MATPLAEKSSNSSLRGQSGNARFQNSPVEQALIHHKLPENFGEVVEGIYRSSFPGPENLPALKKLGLKTIITLVEETYSTAHIKFLIEGGISHYRILIHANKDVNIKTPDDIVGRVLEILLNKANHPVLVHCNKGKHRTGCMVGCFRKVQGWETSRVINEYLRYSSPKSRALDQDFIRAFDPSQLLNLARSSGVSSWRIPMNSILRIEQNEMEQTSPSRRVRSSLNEVTITKYF